MPKQLAETVDIYPTLTELAGLPKPVVPQPIDGLSLVPVLKDPSVRIRDCATHAFPRGEGRIGRAIRTERFLDGCLDFAERLDRAVWSGGRPASRMTVSPVSEQRADGPAVPS